MPLAFDSKVRFEFLTPTLYIVYPRFQIYKVSGGANFKLWTHMRIDVPIWYEDAQGEQEGFGKHAILLPHEIVGTLYHFPDVDLTPKLLGDPGVPWLHLFQLSMDSI